MGETGFQVSEETEASGVSLQTEASGVSLQRSDKEEGKQLRRVKVIESLLVLICGEVKVSRRSWDMAGVGDSA